jgi:hypothetical protein
MLLYVFNYWVPFPSSEYGGLAVVIGEDDEQVYDLVKNSKYYEEGKRLKEAVGNAQKFELRQLEEARIVKIFRT